jgi:hypothetical protein
MTQEFLLFLMFLVVFCFPSTNLQLLDGLPISRLSEFVALAAALPFLLFSGLRTRQADFWKKHKIHPAFLWIGLGAAFVAKIVLLVSGVYGGFSGCYRSPAEPTRISHEDLPVVECEHSYENLFGRYPGTRPDQEIRFGPEGWNLSFLNTSRYNYYEWEEGTILRSRIPIEARWTGSPDIPPGEAIRIEYVGEGSVVWGDIRTTLPPSYATSNVVILDPPGQDSPLQIEYAFDDGSRSGQDPQLWGPKAMITVAAGDSGPLIPVRAEPAGAGFRGLALLADAILLLWLAACLPALWQAVRRDIAFLAAFAAAAGILAFVPLTPLIRSIGITLLLAAATFIHIAFRPQRAAVLYLIAVAGSLAVVRVWATSGFGMVLLRSAGNDPLSYESQRCSGISRPIGI